MKGMLLFTSPGDDTMGKLRLDPDHLRVETFDTVATSRERQGTVRGNGWTGYESCQYCSDWQTCVYSCPPSCGVKPTCEETMCQETCVVPESCGCPTSVYC
jgi:hypothetical protein